MAFVAASCQDIGDPLSPRGSLVDGINDAGVVSGGFTSASGEPTDYTLSPAGNLSVVPFIGGQVLAVDGMNNLGVSVGVALAPTAVAGPNAGVSTGFVNDNGMVTRLPQGNFGSELDGVNGCGVAVGNAISDNLGDQAPFQYNITTGVETPISIAGLRNAHPSDINNLGQMVGYGTLTNGQEESFFLDGKCGSLVVAVPGAVQTEASGLNDIGQIVGDYTDAAGHVHGFLFDLATQAYTTLDDPNGAVSTIVKGLDDSLQAVGYYTNANHDTHAMVVQIAHT